MMADHESPIRRQLPARRRLGQQGLSRRQVLRGGLAGLGAIPLLGGQTLAGPAAPLPCGRPSAAANSPVVVVQGVDPNTLDPDYANGQPEKNVLRHIFDPVLARDAKTLQVVPYLAKAWKNLDDFTWEFSLNQGITFHNGEPLTAQAVKFSLDRIKNDPKNTTGFTDVSFYESTTVVDDHTFHVKTTKPSAILPNLMVEMFVLPPKYYTETKFDTLQLKPVGSGPYVFKEWVKDDHILLEANPHYWRAPATIQQVQFKPVPELSTRVSLLQSGEADVITNVGPDQANLLTHGDNTRTAQVESGRIIFIGIRVDKPPLHDPRVRQALNYAVDFDTINKQLLGGIGRRAATIVNPPHANPELKPYSYDPAKAKALLQEAGVGGGFSVTMDTTNGRYLKDADLAQAVAQNLAAVGVKAEVHPQEWSVYIDDMVFKQATDPLYLLGLGSSFDGQEELAYVAQGYIANATHWDNAQYQQLYDQLITSLDPTKRQAIMNQMQTIAFNDPPLIYLWHQVDLYGVSKRLQWEPRADEYILMYEAKLA